MRLLIAALFVATSFLNLHFSFGFSQSDQFILDSGPHEDLGTQVEALVRLSDEYSKNNQPQEFSVIMKKLATLRDLWEQAGEPEANPAELNAVMEQERKLLQQALSISDQDFEMHMHSEDSEAVESDEFNFPTPHETNGSTLSTNEIVLTFDDGPHPTNTRGVVDALSRNHVPATFFQVGQNVNAYPSLTRLVASKGYSLANHSYTHPRMTRLSDDGLVKEISRTQEAIATALGGEAAFGAFYLLNFQGFFEYVRTLVAPEFFRSPYGLHNARTMSTISGTKAGETHYSGRATKIPLLHVLWSVDSLDWKDKNPKTIEERVFNQIKMNGRRGLILFHDIHAQTVIAINSIVPRLKAENYKIISMYDVLRQRAQSQRIKPR